MAHLGTSRLQFRDHAVTVFSSGCYTLQRSQKNWNTFRCVSRTGKELKTKTSEDLDVLTLQKSSLSIPAELSHGKRSIIVFSVLWEGRRGN
jgi:hypothetical protein